MRLINWGLSNTCPICASHLKQFLPAGVVPRPGALCPVCGSLERHRLVHLYFRQRTDLFCPPRKRLLHVAPEPFFIAQFARNPNIEYVSADLEQSLSRVRMDLTHIPCADGYFDAIYCSHVLEHVGDDRAAMRELCRVLKVTGWAILQVPVNRTTTYEDSTISEPADRERLFGQRDHVRVYGLDYFDRLREAGFKVERDHFVKSLKPADVRQWGLALNDEITMCTKGDRQPRKAP